MQHPDPITGPDDPRLLAFCSTDPTREAIAKPIARGGNLYFFDGRGTVRVTAPDRPDTTGDRVVRPDKLPYWDHADIPDNAWMPVELLPPVTVQRDQRCPKCAGDGDLKCPECYSEYTCPRCNGDGTADIYTPDPVEIRCVPHVTISGAYWHRIRQLPRVRIAIISETEPIRFLFEGGQGLQRPIHD